MGNVILRTNAIPVYGFLSVINARRPEEETEWGKILDCGAGGPVPPLALFREQGFECWGIDTSEEQLELTGQFCDEQGIELNLRNGDMRRIPFEDEAFDYVYEHYSMCHLNHEDTARAVGEMYRVLKPGGLCFLGVISADTWPRSLFGEERTAGEFWGEEDGELTLHSLFTDQGADMLVSAWEIVSKKKHVRYLHEVAQETSLDGWMALHEEAQDVPRDAWRARYETRANLFRYVHLYYVLEKPR